MERSLTVLRVSLHHPTLGTAAFVSVPLELQHDTSPLLIGRGHDTHLQLQVPHLSRRHLSLEPYLEQGSALLAFCLKNLSRKSCVWVNGLLLRFLEQVPLNVINRVSFSNIQMTIHIEQGTSLEAFVCCFRLSPTSLIYRPQAEETDEWESNPQGQPLLGSEERTPVHLGLSTAPPRLGAALSSQALEEEQKYSSRGSCQTWLSAGPASESKPC